MSPFWILLELRMNEAVVTTGAIRRAKLRSNRHHRQTNTQISTNRMLFLSLNQQCQSTGGKVFAIHHGLAHLKAHLAVFQPRLSQRHRIRLLWTALERIIIVNFSH